MMHDRGKSDSAIVAVKRRTTRATGGGAGGAGRDREERRRAKHTPEQGRTRVTQALARLRKAAQQRTKEK